MFRPFSFEKTKAQEPSDRNWRVFDEASKSIVRTDLVLSNPSGASVVTRGTFTLYGPIVFYSLSLSVPNGDGWLVSSYITMPFSPLIENGVFLAPHYGFMFIGELEATIGYAYFSDPANPLRLNLAAGYTNSTGATTTPTIQGWYYRN